MREPIRTTTYLTRAIVLDDQRRIVRATINTMDVDRFGTIIVPEGGQFDGFMRSSSVLWNHDLNFPLGRPLEIERSPKILGAIWEFADASGVQDRGPMLTLLEDVWFLYSSGFIKGHSLRFQPLAQPKMRKDGVLVYDSWDLVEFSLTPTPANPNAYAENKRAYHAFLRVTPREEVRSYLHGLPKITRRKLIRLAEESFPKDQNALLRTIEEDGDAQKYYPGVTLSQAEDVSVKTQVSYLRSAVPFKETPKAPLDHQWDGEGARERLAKWASSDGSGEKDKMDWGKYKQGFAWFDEENPENFGSYKLPHHDIIDGQLKVVKAGVVAASNAFSGARGGTDIPEKDRPGVREHLNRERARFEDLQPLSQDTELTPQEEREEREEELAFAEASMKMAEEVLAITEGVMYHAGKVLENPKGDWKWYAWDKSEAEAWLKDHGFSTSQYAQEPNFHAFRQKDPQTFSRIRSKWEGKRTKPEKFAQEDRPVKFLFGFPKDGSSSQVQSIAFYHGARDLRQSNSPRRSLPGGMLPHLATRVFDTPLLIHQNKLEVILSVLGERMGLSSQHITHHDEEPVDAQQGVTAQGIAVIPIVGTLVQRTMGVNAVSGLTSYKDIEKQFLAAVSNPQVRGILLDVDSPGGEATGVFDLADTIFQARGTKPIWAFANEQALSAAYAIASSADKIFLPRTGVLGSIGVYALHVDQSELDKKLGLSYTFIHAGEHKIDGNPHSPLSQSEVDEIQQEVDQVYDLFVSTVSRNRALDEEDVRNTEAMIFMGEEAVSMGLADAVLSERDVIKQLEEWVMRLSDMSQPQEVAQPVDAPADVSNPLGGNDKPSADVNSGKLELAVTEEKLQERIRNLEQQVTELQEQLHVKTKQYDELVKAAYRAVTKRSLSRKSGSRK
jgi:signal peptide peptidase SppA